MKYMERSGLWLLQFYYLAMDVELRGLQKFENYSQATQKTPRRISTLTILHRVRYSASSINFQSSVFAYVFFLVFLSLLSSPLSFLQSSVLEGSYYARCDQSS
jgi:hypothetical protein